MWVQHQKVGFVLLVHTDASTHTVCGGGSVLHTATHTATHAATHTATHAATHTATHQICGGGNKVTQRGVATDSKPIPI